MQWPEVSANIQSASANSTLVNNTTDSGIPLTHSTNNNTNGLSLKSMPSLPLGLAGAFPMYPQLCEYFQKLLFNFIYVYIKYVNVMFVSNACFLWMVFFH